MIRYIVNMKEVTLAVGIVNSANGNGDAGFTDDYFLFASNDICFLFPISDSMVRYQLA